jgi:hypothetical protein
MTLSVAPFESRMRISPRRKQAWPFAISNIVDHAKFYSRSHDAAISIYDESGNVLERSRTHGRFQRMVNFARIAPDFAVKLMFNVSAFFRLSPGEQPD